MSGETCCQRRTGHLLVERTPARLATCATMALALAACGNPVPEPPTIRLIERFEPALGGYLQ